jgi:chromosome condensin MukBEF ATPase and DNA-binding subunit MukB
MSKSQCTCKHRNPLASWNDSAYQHEQDCPLTARLRELANEKEQRDSARRLYSHYQRQAKQS